MNRVEHPAWGGRPGPHRAGRTRPGGYEVRCSDRIAEDHPSLVDQIADWLEDEVGAVNLGQIDHRALLADGVLSRQSEDAIVAWWTERVEGLDQGTVG